MTSRSISDGFRPDTSKILQAPPEYTRLQSKPRGGVNPLSAWLALIGLVVPSEVQIFVAGAKLTAGRIGIISLLIPAISRLSQPGRRLLLSDLFALGTVAWMLGATIYTSGLNSLSSTTAESIEFLGSYIVGRGLFFGRSSLDSFVRVLKVLTLVLITLGLADSISGRLIVHDTIAAMFSTTPPLSPDYRLGTVRAASTLDHPILFGEFCSLAGSIFLYSERRFSKRILWVGICMFGCLLSLSSAPLLSFFIILSLYTYDRLLKRYSGRWKALWLGVTALIAAVWIVTNHPIGWIISHLTLDPLSGYYRIMIWNYALPKISEAPFAGFSFESFDNDVLDHTIDSAWLVFALRFGIPMIAFLFLTNLAACSPTRGRGEPYVNDIRTAFSIILVMFILNGLTVHYWNFMFIFWGLCIGIRASLRELSIKIARTSTPNSAKLAQVNP